MNLRQYIVFMLIGTFLCWVAWSMVLLYFDPTTGGWLGFIFFYSALYLALVGTFALVGLVFRIYILRHEIVFRQVTIAFRQAFSFAFLVIAALFLQSKELLTWWNMLFLVGALTFVEFAVLVRQKGAKFYE